MNNIYIRLFLISILVSGAYSQDNTIAYNSEARNLLNDALSVNTNADTSSNPELNENDITRKSPGRAFLYSLILPGSGEIYTGYKNRAAVFLGIEVLSPHFWQPFAVLGKM